MEELFAHLREEPIATFAIMLAIILIIPPLFEKLKLPGLLGLLLAGLLVGPNVLHVVSIESEAMELLSDIGLVYLMFVAGLEIDIEQFNRTKDRAATFGAFTFFFPLIAGALIGRLFGFGWNASILLGSIFSSHTLLAYPIVSRLGVVGNEAVTVTIGATIITDIGALLVLAVSVGVNAGDFSLIRLITLLVSLLIYSSIVLFGFDRLGKIFFERSGDEEGNQFLFILLVVFLASLGAELIGVEKIVGAFLAGLAVNEVLGESPVKEKVVFIGSVLFIPIFFVDIGLIIDVNSFISSISSLWLSLAIAIGLIIGKFLAAYSSKLLYKYDWNQTMTMWSLSLPQVAATLAAALVGYREDLLSNSVLNSIVLLMVFTSTLGTILTKRFAAKLVLPGAGVQETSYAWVPEMYSNRFKVMVPVYNPNTEQHLVELASLLARHEEGGIFPLAVASAHMHMDANALADELTRARSLLANASEISKDIGIESETILRIDDSVYEGISRASREQRAHLIVMGWSEITGLKAKLFGTVIDRVLEATHCPVAVTRLLGSPMEIDHILVPIKSPRGHSMQMLRFAYILADANHAQVTLLNVCSPSISSERIEWRRSQFKLLADNWLPDCDVEVKIMPHRDPIAAIVAESSNHNLVILRSLRRRTVAGGIAISDVAEQLVQKLNCSMMILGEPHKQPVGILADVDSEKKAKA